MIPWHIGGVILADSGQLHIEGVILADLGHREVFLGDMGIENMHDDECFVSNFDSKKTCQ